MWKIQGKLHQSSGGAKEGHVRFPMHVTSYGYSKCCETILGRIADYYTSCSSNGAMVAIFMPCFRGFAVANHDDHMMLQPGTVSRVPLPTVEGDASGPFC